MVQGLRQSPVEDFHEAVSIGMTVNGTATKENAKLRVNQLHHGRQSIEWFLFVTQLLLQWCQKGCKIFSIKRLPVL